MANTPVSPIKGLSVREDASGCAAIHKKIGKNKYVCLSNFFFRIDAFVKFPLAAHTRYNGYMLFVQRVDEVSMECYVTVDEMESVKKFKAAINRSFAAKGGVIWQGVNDQQLSTYIMDKLKEFVQSRDAKRFHGALVIGRQPNYRKVEQNGTFLDDPDNNPGVVKEGSKIKHNDFDTAVYIFSDEVQMDYNGLIDQPKHKYMVPFLKLMPAAMNDRFINNFLEEYPVHIDVPLVPFDWKMFISQAKIFFKINFMPFLMFTCGGISAFHFEQIVSRVGCCPVATAIGEVCSGKSTALHVIGKMLGLHFASQSSGEYVCSTITKTTIPLSWDDPSLPSLVDKPLMSVFNGYGKQTKGHGNEKPITSFILTVNFKMEDNMRSFERTTPIWFSKLVTSENDRGEKFLELRSVTLEMASTDCLIDVIRLGRRINAANLAEHHSFFEDKLPGLSPRLPDIYSVYRLIAFEIVKLVDDDTVLNTVEVDGYLTTNFIPFVLSMYSGTAKAHTSFEDFFRLLVQAIIKLDLKRDTLSRWLRPLIKGKKEKIDYLAFIVPRAITAVDRAGFEKPSEKNVRDLAKNLGVKNANVNHKASFAGMVGKVSCVKVARSILPKECVDEIDKVFELSNEGVTEAENEDEYDDGNSDDKIGCNNCGNLLDEMKSMEGRFDIQVNEMENAHEQQLLALRKEFDALRKENEKLRKEIIEKTNSENEMKRQIGSLSGMLRQVEAKSDKCMTVAKSQSDEQHGNSVTMAVARIVGDSEKGQSPKRNLNDSGLGQELEYTNETADSTSKSRRQKRPSPNQSSNLNRCNLCTKKKITNMIMCTKCSQWQHCSRAGLTYKEAKAIQGAFSCTHCI